LYPEIDLVTDCLYGNEIRFLQGSAQAREHDLLEIIEEGIKHRFTRAHAPQVMVLGVVASDGQKMPAHFMKGKVDTDQYLWALRYRVLPWVKATYGSVDRVTFQQDGAPAHTSNKTQEWLAAHFPSFWSKDKWPPNSPDLNPIDFSVWAYVERRACAHSHPNLDSLRDAIVHAWDSMPKEFVQKACAAFRPRLEAVIMAGGHHI
jgi:hypothetical protein